MPRLFRNHPGYVVMATCVLAVAIGVNLLVFTVVNALWIRPMPFPEPDRLVIIPLARVIRLDGPDLRIFDGRVAGQVFTADTYGGVRPWVKFVGFERELETLGVTSGYFRLFGLAIRGRDFTIEDDRDGAEPVAIISDRLWSSRFGRRLDVIGAMVPARPIPIRVIGVAPPGFAGARRGERADMWVPTAVVRRLVVLDGSSATAPMIVYGRLGPGQTPTMMDRRYREVLDQNYRDRGIDSGTRARIVNAQDPFVVPLNDVFGTPDTQTFIVTERNAALVVSGLALLVLLGGCVTIAALVLVHYERRRAELALKISLGATRLRLVRELLCDLLLVALTGSVSGILVAALGVHVVPAISLPGSVDIGRLDLSLDWTVCAVAFAATVVTLLVTSALPMARSTRPRLAGELIVGPSSTTLASQRLRQALLAVQVCATMIVLVAAGLFVRAVIHSFGKAPGFDVDRTVFVSVQEGNPQGSENIIGVRVATVERTARLMQVLRELPGVIEVSEGLPPIGPDAPRLGLTLGGTVTVKAQDREHQLSIGLLRGSPELPSVLGIPILTGRHLTAADSGAVPVPAIITKSLAGRLWPDGRALGQILSLQMRRGPYLVVGLTPDLAFGSLAQPASGAIITAQPILDAIVSHFAIRTDRPDLVAGSVRRTVRGQVVRVATGRELVARDIGRQRLGAWFFSGFGLAALLLGVGGAFGLVAYLAESRRREFGVRMALGATMGHLVRQGLAAALAPVSAGIAAGLLLAGVVSQMFKALLVGVSAFDTVTYAGGTVAMLCSATFAALAAASRLRRTSPSEALHRT